MTRFRLLIFALAIALCGSSLVVPGALARQGADCEGIDSYIEAINATGNPVTAPQDTDLPEGFIDEWDDAEIEAATAEMLRIQGELEDIDPPAAAEAFHATLIEAMGALAELMGTVGDSGLDAAMSFSEDVEALDTRLYDDGLAVEEACQVPLLDHDFDGEPEIGEGDGFEPATAATVEAPEAPPIQSVSVAVGTPAMLDDQWELTVLSVTPDATAAVLAYDPSNTPPEDGDQYLIARVKITNIGASDGSFSDWRLSLEDPSGLTYAPFIDYCGFIEDELTTDTIAPGESAEGNVCWAVPAAEAAAPGALALFDGDAFPGDRLYFSLDAPDGTTGGGFADAIGNAGEGVLSGFGTPEAESADDNG